jgi:hypothetical protein
MSFAPNRGRSLPIDAGISGPRARVGRLRRGFAATLLAMAAVAVCAAGVSPPLASAGFGPPGGPTSPPFWQCPAVGKSTSCAFLIDVTNSGTSVYQDSSQEFYDLGGDDEMVAVQNDSSTPLASIHIGVPGSGDFLFGFDEDGLCNPGVGAVPSGCPFGPGGNNEDPYDYYGPGMAFAPGYSSDDGTVEFTPALQTGQYAYFGLDAPFEQVVIPVGGNDYLTTKLTGGTPEAEPVVSAPAPTPITDQATIVGPNAAEAAGTISYKVYSDPACSKPVEGGNATPTVATFEHGVVPASKPVGAALTTNAVYYWQATFESSHHEPAEPNYNSNSVTACGAETMSFGTPPTRPTIGVSTTLAGGGQSGPNITVLPNTPVTDTAVITGTNASAATGVVTYTVFADAGCTQQVRAFSVGTDIRSVAGGAAGASGALALPLGTYYFRATYSGDETHAPAQSTCGGEVLTVAVPPPPPAPNSGFTLQGIMGSSNGTVTITFVPTQAGTATLVMTVPTASIASTTAVAAKARKSKKCKTGKVKIRGKCRPSTTVAGEVSAAGTAGVPLKLTVNLSSKIKAQLKKGKTVHLTATLTYQSSLGGTPTVQAFSVTVKGKKHKHKHH